MRKSEKLQNELKELTDSVAISAMNKRIVLAENIEAKLFKENEEFYFWKMNYGNDKECLAVGTFSSCDNCKAPSDTNSVWVVGHVNHSLKQQADQIKEFFGEITELGADDVGNCYCEECYGQAANLNEEGV